MLAMTLFGVAPLAAQNGSGADWIQVDTSAREVKLDIVSGLTSENFSWNFNGYFGGGATLTVPVGYRVVIDFRNDDKAVPHSIGVSEIQTPFPPLLTDLTPVFEGAISENPISMTESTMPGESETVIFTADREGTYALLCYIPAHAATGMWITLEVSSDGAVSFDPGD